MAWFYLVVGMITTEELLACLLACERMLLCRALGTCCRIWGFLVATLVSLEKRCRCGEL